MALAFADRTEGPKNIQWLDCALSKRVAGCGNWEKECGGLVVNWLKLISLHCYRRGPGPRGLSLGPSSLPGQPRYPSPFPKAWACAVPVGSSVIVCSAVKPLSFNLYSFNINKPPTTKNNIRRRDFAAPPFCDFPPKRSLAPKQACPATTRSCT